MKHIPRLRWPVRPVLMFSVVASLLWLGESTSHAAKILYIINSLVDDVTTANANDQEVRDRLVGQGHSVKLADDDTVSPADTTGMDLVLISSSTGSGQPGVNPLSRNTLRTGRVPVVCYEPGLYDELLWQTQNTFGNANGHTSLAISTANQKHPLAAGKSGTIEIVTPGETAVVSSSALPYTVGTNAIIIATNATPDVDVGRISIWAYDTGARLADNATITAGRKVAFFYNATTPPGAYNDNAIALFDAALKWALEPPPSVPLTVASRSPDANQTGVPRDATIAVDLEDGSSTQVNQTSIKLTVNGAAVTPVITKAGTRTKITFKPSTPFGNSQDVTVELSFADTASPPKTFTNNWQFTAERSAITLAPLRQDQQGLVVIEAENFDVKTAPGQHGWVFVKSPAGFSGDGAMYASPDAPGAVIDYPDALTTSPRLDFKVSFQKTGTHYFWFRGSDGGGNSINAGFNGDSPADTMNNIDEGCCGTRLVPSGTTWTWVGGIDGTPDGRSKFEVASAGVHTVNIWMREDGQIVDKVLITTDPNFIPTGAGPPENRRVGEPVKPVVTISSPTEGAVIPASGDVAIAANAADADGTVVKVEFFEGDNKIGEDTTAPFSISWKPSAERSYTLTAKATDNTGDSATSLPVKVVFGNPPKVLYLGNNPTANAGDLVIIRRLESKGFQVTAVDDNDSQTSDADGKTLIVISSTVGSGNITDKYTAVPLPIINWEEAVMDDLLMTGDSAADPDHHGSTGTQTALDIVNPSHPLAAGLAAGRHTVSTSPQTFSWGFPEANTANAIIVAYLAGSTNQVGIYAYEKGATLFDGVTKAPARRVGFFVNGDSTTALNEVGFQLFDAALNWALNISVSQPAKLALIRAANGATLSWTGSGRLQQADAVIGPWTDAASQSNPQTVATAGGTKFYRIRQ
ncbi:MAG: Ig-like domain-containing protein [Verrucomicrobia bacterium]|nr:Ig-like domain-containing protein [Verrucomicrobiota bacterium]